MKRPKKTVTYNLSGTREQHDKMPQSSNFDVSGENDQDDLSYEVSNDVIDDGVSFATTDQIEVQSTQLK